MITLKLPTLAQINVCQDYDDFYMLLLKKAGLKVKKGVLINQSAFIVNPECEHTLSDIIKIKVRKQNKGMPVSLFNRAWQWHYFNYSPATHTCVQCGYVLIDKKKVMSFARINPVPKCRS